MRTSAELDIEIAQHKEVEAELQRLRHELGTALKMQQRIMDFSLDVICTIDEDGRFAQVSTASEQVWGYPSRELIGRAYMELVYSEDHRKTEHAAHEIMAGKSAGDFENRYVRKDGSLVDIMWSAFWSVEDKTMFCVARDITERKRAENAQRAVMEELARSNAELEQFAYVASHDLQEPLRAVAGVVQILQRRYEGKLDARADELIHHAVDGVLRMQTLINDLLAYSRVSTHGNVLKPTDCAAVVQEVLINLQTAIKESGAVISFGTMPTVTGDASQLRQVFQNLISNAIKFRGAGAPEIHIGVEREQNQWIFSVRDNGIGIGEEYFDRIFVLFQRLHTRQEHPGTGIGLAICKKIIERHGGRIWVESKNGQGSAQGSTFYFTIASN